jgi:RNA recognition motif-containing protein
MNIYVGNLSYETQEDELRDAFKNHGEVESVNIIKDRYSGESRGFGFVQMPNDDEAKTALAELNGTDLNGKTLTVNEARPRNDRSGGGRPRGGGGGRGRNW